MDLLSVGAASNAFVPLYTVQCTQETVCASPSTNNLSLVSYRIDKTN